MKHLGMAADLGHESSPVITGIEQVTSGDTLVTFGVVTRFDSGRIGSVSSPRTVRLTPAEREDLIQRLTDHRFADIAAGIDGGADQRQRPGEPAGSILAWCDEALRRPELDGASREAAGESYARRWAPRQPTRQATDEEGHA